MNDDRYDRRHGPATWPPVTLVVLTICAVAVVADGYDVVVFGTVIPSLLRQHGWGLTPANVGLMGSIALTGMLIGATVVGTLAETVGRRLMLIGCLAWFSVLTGLCALAPSAEVFGALRFLAGLGLGGVMPLATALAGEYSHPSKRNLVFAILFSGMPVGGIIASLTGEYVIPRHGWQAMFLPGLLPLVLVVPFALRFLPESIAFLLAKGRGSEAGKIADRWHISLDAPKEAHLPGEAPAGHHGSSPVALVKDLFSRRYILATGCFLVMTFLCLFVIYGFNTWLPEIMRRAGYSSGSALVFLLMFNLGGFLGSLVISLAADRIGSKPTIVTTFLLGSAAVTALSLHLPTAVLYGAVALGGAGAMGTQTFVFAYVSKHYPARLGAAAMGWTVGFGRLGSMLAPTVLGLIIGAGFAFRWNFYALAVPGVLGAAVVALVPRGLEARPRVSADRAPLAVAEQN